MWAVPDTKLLLVDCVGSTSCDVAHSDAAVAGLMLVVMGDSNRAEHMHGDYLLWAMRLEDTVRTIFVLPEFDQVFQQGTRRYASKLLMCSLFVEMQHDASHYANCTVLNLLMSLYADQWPKHYLKLRKTWC
jgi:hypothetical protein